MHPRIIAVLFHTLQVSAYYFPYDYYYPDLSDLQPNECAKYVPQESCFKKDCYNDHWPTKRDLADGVFDQVSQQQLNGDCEALATVDRHRYLRCLAIRHDAPGFAERLLAHDAALDTEATDQNSSSIPANNTANATTTTSSPTADETTSLISRTVKFDSCCRLTDHCYGIVKKYSKMWYAGRKGLIMLKCCLNLWELSCWNSGYDASKVPKVWKKPPRCSMPTGVIG